MIKTILNNSLFLFITNSLIKLAMLIVSIFVARISGKEIFGQYMLIRNTLSTFELFSTLGMNLTSIKFISEDSGDNNKLQITFITILFVVFLTTSLLSSLVFIFSESLVFHLFNNQTIEVINALRISCLILIFSVLSLILTSVLNGLDKYKQLAFSNLISIIIFIIPSLFLITYFNLIGALISVLLFFICSSIYKLIIVKKYISIKIVNFELIKNKFMEIIKFTIPIFLSIIFIIPVFWYSKTLLLHYNSNGFLEIANFEASYQILTIVLVVCGAVSNVSLSMFSKNNLNSLNIFRTNLIINILISCIFSAICILFNQEILNIYGQDFKDTCLLSILVLSSIPFTIQTLINRFLTSISKVWINFYISAVWSFIFSNIIYFNLQTINSLLLAQAFISSYIITCLISIIYIFYHFKKTK